MAVLRDRRIGKACVVREAHPVNQIEYVLFVVYIVERQRNVDRIRARDANHFGDRKFLLDFRMNRLIV